MSEEKQARRHNSGLFRVFERGVDTAARNNVTAMGYSISITAAFALLQTSRNARWVMNRPAVLVTVVANAEGGGSPFSSPKAGSPDNELFGV